MVRIFPALPMDWDITAFRIEGLTSRHKGSLQSVQGRSADREAARNDDARGARALCGGSTRAGRLWCQSVAIETSGWNPRSNFYGEVRLRMDSLQSHRVREIEKRRRNTAQTIGSELQRLT
jgi:hypothetical protein